MKQNEIDIGTIENLICYQKSTHLRASVPLCMYLHWTIIRIFRTWHYTVLTDLTKVCLTYYLRFLYYLFLKSSFFSKVEPGTLLLRLVNSQEFKESVNTSLVWFTDCDNFSNLNNSNFQICLAGVGKKRLYYDDANRYLVHYSKLL